MSIPTSKSKTQLAYARSTKAVNKPKSKTNNLNQQSDLSKTKQNTKSPTNNIYDSIMGQIDTTQQDYIKSLIVKNEKQTLKSQKESQKQLTKNIKDTHQLKKSNTISKTPKQTTLSHKGSTNNLHQKTKSQTDLLYDSQVEIQTEKIIKLTPQNKINEIRCDSQQAQNSIALSQVKSIVSNIQTNKKQQLSANLQQIEKKQKLNSTNPIIQALNNTSASFAKKLQAFQLQYPSEERQQRSTHKKVGSKLSGEFFSCQASPKNGSKHLYTQEVVITTKPEQNYYSSANKYDRHQSTKISPISATKNSTVKINPKKLNQNDENLPTSFLSCLDEYLQALTQNQSDGQQNNRPSNGSYNMKRKNSNKIKDFPVTKGFNHAYALDKQDEEQETIVLQNINYHNSLNNKTSLPKNLSVAQQQKLIKQLENQRRKNYELKKMINNFNQQMSKQKKKQKKLKENQFHMLEQMKLMEYELTIQRQQRRKLDKIVREFQSKLSGMSREKDKKRRGSMEEDIRPQRKTIYGVSSSGNSIHFGHPANNFYYEPEMMQKETPHKFQKQSKKGSKNRFSSVINSLKQQYERNALNADRHLDDCYVQKRAKISDNGFSKNRTQKMSKIISSFELDHQPMNDDQQMVYRSSQMRNSIKNMNPPQSCKNSYMNSSLPGPRQTKSRPMTPELISQLFKGNKRQKVSQKEHRYLNQRIQNHNFESESEEQLSPEYVRQQRFEEQQRDMNESEIEQQSSFNPTVNSDESYDYEQQSNNNYRNAKQSEMMMRMR